MGQKTNPRGFRLGITETWSSNWFAQGGQYSKQVHEDIKIREFLKEKLYHTGVSKIEINRAAGNAVVPLGTEIHNIELSPNGGGKLVRSAGTVAQLMAREGSYAQVKMPSGEVRMIHIDCKATIGQVGNQDFENVNIGKAGRTRHLGKKPHVRGTAMNPVDHPHGGGEGRTKGGRNPVTPWGKCTKGMKTRHRPAKFVIKDRRA